MTLNSGDLLNERYRIVSLVGDGGFGAVYEAEDLNLSGKRVALKGNLLIMPQAREQFKTEALLLAHLQHSHLPRVTDYFERPGGGQYMVMDFIAGRSLQDILKGRLEMGRGPLTEAEALPWIRQVADALAFLHAQDPPIIHRDVKPDNIILRLKGGVMLVDFGIAKSQSGQTAPGAKGATAGYAPPEQYDGATEPRSDIYALGATLYALLIGEAPPRSTERSAGSVELRPPQQLNPSISRATSAAILWAMQLRIDERPASIAALMARLPAAADFSGSRRRDDTELNPTGRSATTGEETEVHPSPDEPLSSLPRRPASPHPHASDLLWKWLPFVMIMVALLVAGVIWMLWSAAATPDSAERATATAVRITAIAAIQEPTAQPTIVLTPLNTPATAPPITSAPVNTSTIAVTDTPTTPPTATPTIPKTVGPPMARVVRSVFTRSGPGLIFPQSGSLVEGEVVEVLGRDSQGDWFVVQSSRDEVWVSAGYIEPMAGSLDDVEPAATLPAPPTPTPTPVPPPPSGGNSGNPPPTEPTTAPTELPPSPTPDVPTPPAYP